MNIRKTIQSHDFLNGGPKIQYTIDFTNNISIGGYYINTTISDIHTMEGTYIEMGTVRYNVGVNCLEFFDGVIWQTIN